MMYQQKSLLNRRLSKQRLFNYVRRTPYLTASQYGRLLGKPYGTISAALYKLSKEGVLRRFKGQPATADKGESWRYRISIVEP